MSHKQRDLTDCGAACFAFVADRRRLPHPVLEVTQIKQATILYSMNQPDTSVGKKRPTSLRVGIVLMPMMLILFSTAHNTTLRIGIAIGFIGFACYAAMEKRLHLAVRVAIALAGVFLLVLLGRQLAT
ncbi:MAG TPA: hypothetical protein PLG56_04265 [Lacunisphaera sp.]|nr:hypothetical protein [Lacunisphaera sp.]